MTPNDSETAVAQAATVQTGFFAVDPPRPLDERLADLEARYRSLIDRLPAVVYIDGVGEADSMVDVSRSVHDLLGITREEWLSSCEMWRDILHPDDRDRVIASSDRCVRTGEPFHEEFRAIHRDGRVLWIREDAILVRDERGSAPVLARLHARRDRPVDAQHQLLEAQTKYGALVEQIPAIVYVDLADEFMTSSYVSPQIEALLGYTQREYIEDPELWQKMLHPDDRDAAVDAYMRGRDSGEPFVFEYRLSRGTGRVLWFRDSAIVLRDDEGRPHLIQGVMLDITDRQAAEEQIAFLAYHDKLTGLPNRAMFDELLDLALARARRADQGVAVILVDLDDFKLVNDSLGHDAGDALIAELAERMREATRDTDLVARPGGDEFLRAAGRPRSHAAHAGRSGRRRHRGRGRGGAHPARAERLRSTIGGTELYVTASLGISVFPEDAADAVALLKNADTAMYRSKAAGPGGFLTHAREDASAITRLSLSTRLRKAVEQKQWMLHYQPLIELDSGQIFGVEALIRWPEPNGGLVPPGEFIPLAEEMGLIEAIGDWVVEEICRQDAQWRAEGLELEIGFNLSPRQLWQPDLVDKIVSPIVVAGMDPTRVTVEITESTAMTDPDRTIAILRRAARARAQARHRRLRYRLLLAGPTEAHAGGHPEDRSIVRARRGPGSRRRQHGLGDDLARQQPRDDPRSPRGSRPRPSGASSWTGAAPWVRASTSRKPVPALDVLAICRRSSMRVIDGEAIG